MRITPFPIVQCSVWKGPRTTDRDTSLGYHTFMTGKHVGRVRCLIAGSGCLSVTQQATEIAHANHTAEQVINPSKNEISAGQTE